VKKNIINTEDGQKLRQEAEGLLGQAGTATEDLSGMSPRDIAKLVHELRVHQIELKMQNDELRRIQAQLENARDRYEHLYDFAPTAYFTVNEKGAVAEANLTAASLLDRPRAELVGRMFSGFIHREDQDVWYLHLKRMLEAADFQTFQLRLVQHDNGVFDANLECMLVEDRHSVCKHIRIAATDISGLKRAEAALRESNERLQVAHDEKEVLLKEIHHRVKNNMQVITSLLALQADALPDPAMRDAFKDVVRRVRSMALVHEKLYLSTDLARVEFADYVKSLLKYLWNSYETSASGIRLKLDLQPVSLTVSAAIPCGLILNELVVNSMKHAFYGRDHGQVDVSLRNIENGRVQLCVCDDGVGLPPGFVWSESKTLGLRLVMILAVQMHASVVVSSGKGTEFTINFERTKK
jgi:PAS domain S-box-containing protein